MDNTSVFSLLINRPIMSDTWQHAGRPALPLPTQDDTEDKRVCNGLSGKPDLCRPRLRQIQYWPQSGNYIKDDCEIWKQLRARLRMRSFVLYWNRNEMKQTPAELRLDCESCSLSPVFCDPPVNSLNPDPGSLCKCREKKKKKKVCFMFNLFSCHSVNCSRCQ